MAWSTEKLYIASNPATIAWLSKNGRPYYHLRPPVVPAPIIVAGDITPAQSQRKPFEEWAASASVVDPSDLAERFLRMTKCMVSSRRATGCLR